MNHCRIDMGEGVAIQLINLVITTAKEPHVMPGVAFNSIICTLLDLLRIINMTRAFPFAFWLIA